MNPVSTKKDKRTKGNGPEETKKIKPMSAPLNLIMKIAVFTDTFLPTVNGVVNAVRNFNRMLTARGERVKVTEAEVVLVAVDGHGRPTPIRE